MELRLVPPWDDDRYRLHAIVAEFEKSSYLARHYVAAARKKTSPRLGLTIAMSIRLCTTIIVTISSGGWAYKQPHAYA